MIIDSLTKRYGEHTVFSDVNMTIERGEKVAFVGKNGSGKSTLIKCIMGEVSDYTGTLKLGHNVEIGYFAKRRAKSWMGTTPSTRPSTAKRRATFACASMDLLGAFMFGGEESEKKVVRPRVGASVVV